ncbi:MAG: hypothetical protein ABJP48_00115 [Erythrobacter sp.]
MARTNNSILPMEQSTERRGGIGRWKWYILAVFVVIIGLAWFDGGEEPLHPIVQEIGDPLGNGPERL